MSDLPDHRGGECSHCDGVGSVELPYTDLVTGRPGDDEPECDGCEGHGDILWDWYPDDNDGYCSDCKAEGIKVMGYGEDGEEGCVCLPCYLRWHATQCGCGAWPMVSP
jgi:hypothetical protein